MLSARPAFGSSGSGSSSGVLTGDGPGPSSDATSTVAMFVCSLMYRALAPDTPTMTSATVTRATPRSTR